MQRKDHKDAVGQITMTVIGAYTTYYVADHIAGTSGVIATVVCALIYCARGRSLIGEPEMMEHVWHWIEFVGNSLIFFLSGTFIGKDIVEAFEEGHDIEGGKNGETVDFDLSGSDVGWLVVVFLLMVLVRALMMLLFYPILRWRPGGRGSDTYLITKEDAIVCAWGGLRGPVGLALAVLMNEELPLNEGARVLFHVGGIALLTLVVNGLSCARLMRRLGLTHTPAAVVRMKHYLKKHVSRHVQHEYAKFRKSKRFAGADDHILTSYVSALTYCDQQHDPIENGGGGGDGGGGECATTKETLCRRMFISLLRSAYNKQLEEGLLLATIPGASSKWFSVSGKIAATLFESVDIAMDRSRKPLADWAAIEHSGGMAPKSIRWCTKALGDSCSDWFDRKDALFKGMEAVLFTCFIDAHKETQHELGRMWGDPDAAARLSFAEHLIATKALRCTATA